MSRQKAANFNTVNYDLSPFMPHNTNMNRSASFENESIETLREKLKIKSEALNLLGKQLDLCNKEKIEYKRLIDTLYDKNLLLKKNLYFKENQIDADDENFFSNKKDTIPTNRLTESSSKINKSNNLTVSNISSISPNNSTNCLFNDIDSEDYVKILKDLIKQLQKEKFELIQKYEDTQQQLNDSRSDLRLLREQIVRQRVGSFNEGLTTTIKLDFDETDLFTPFKINLVNVPSNSLAPPEKKTISTSLSTSNISSLAANNVKENLIKEIEMLREQKTTVENDLKLILCQKEEIEIERDSFKSKYLKLNEFLIASASTDLIEKNHEKEYVNQFKTFETKLKSLNKSQIRLSVDELISQNKFFSETNLNLKEELENCKNSLKKYKNSMPKDGASLNFENTPKNFQADTALISNVFNKADIKNLLKAADKILSENNKNDQSIFAIDPSIIKVITDLKLVMESMIESLNDKSIACSHQRKVNKMLATRIQDLEQQIEFHNNNNSQNKCSFTTTPATPTDRSTANYSNFKNVSPYSALTMMNATSGLILDEPLIPISTYGANTIASTAVKNAETDENLNTFESMNKNTSNIA